MQAQGAPQKLIDELKQESIIEILPMNWPIIVWFNEVCDLMHYRNDGACLGLDLVQVKAESDMSQRKYTQTELSGLRIMSKAAARALNKID